MATATTDPDAELHDDMDQVFPWRNVLGLLLLGFALMCLHGWREFDGRHETILTDPETMEMAALGRNMSQGRGFIASCVRPADLWFMESHSREPVKIDHIPDIRHGPVFPSLLAAVYVCTGINGTLPLVDFTHRAEYFVILPLTVTFTLLAGFLMFLATRRLAGNAAAMVALAMFVLALPVVETGLWGGASALLLFLGAASLLSVVRCVAHRDGRHGDETAGWLAPLLLAGFLAGISILTRYGSFVMGLAMLVYLFQGHDRKRCWVSCVVFLVTVLVTISPWVIRNIMVTGAPFGMAPYSVLNNSALFEGNGFDASLHPVLGNLAVTRAVKIKLIVNSLGLLQGNLAALGSGVVMILFGAALFVRFGNERLVALRHATLSGVLVMMGVVALSGTGTLNHMTDLLPCIFVLASAGFYALIHNIDFHEPEQETLTVLALVVWMAAPTALTLFGAGEHRAYPPYHPPFIRYVSGLLSKGETVCTDIPWATAWYGGRTSILLPRSVDSLSELKETVPTLSGLYITTETLRSICNDAGTKSSRVSWRPLLSGQIPPDFPFTEAIAFPPTTRDQWFYTDNRHLKSR